MTNYIIVSIISGILFGILDGLINANPIAVRLYEVYKPIARIKINFVAGISSTSCSGLSWRHCSSSFIQSCRVRSVW